jgi:multisite-specific tRNA:(cytosine-C5)-methyltransferase
MGCCVLRIEPSDDEDGFEERMVLPLWRSMASLNLMLAKEDRTAMLLRIFNDTTPLINNSTKKREIEEPEKVDPEDGDRKDLAPGFILEEENFKVDVSSAIEGAAPINDRATNVEIKPGPYGEVVGTAAEDHQVLADVKAENINKGADTCGPEQQLNGTGVVEGQLGSLS